MPTGRRKRYQVVSIIALPDRLPKVLFESNLVAEMGSATGTGGDHQ